MKRTRVLLFVGSLEIGGTERNVLHIARSLDRDRFEVEVWCNYEGQPLQKAVRDAGVPCNSLKRVSLGLNPLARLLRHNLPYQWRLWRLLRKNRHAVIHVFGFPMAYYVALLGALAGARRILFSVQDWDVWKKGRLYRALDRLASRVAWGIVADGAGAARMAVERQGMDARKVEVIYDGVDTSELRPAKDRAAVRAELGAGVGDVLVAVVARLDARKKGQDVALAAVGRIAESAPQAKLVFVGDGPDRGLLESAARDLAPAARPVFAGFRGDLADTLNACDILLIPSRWESVPKVLLEAMWLERPVVATKVGDIEEVFDERAGRLIEADDPDALAKAVAELANAPALRRQLGSAGRAILLERGLTLDRSIKAIEERYERAAKG